MRSSLLASLAALAAVAAAALAVRRCTAEDRGRPGPPVAAESAARKEAAGPRAGEDGAPERGAAPAVERRLERDGSDEAGEAETERLALHGTVRDLRGAAVAGATVELSIGDVPRIRESATSDERGAYRLAAWPTGPEREALDPFEPLVVARAPGFAPLVVEPLSRVGDGTAGDLRLDLWLTRGWTLAGTVVTAADGQPVGGALLRLECGAATTSASDGSFELGPVPAFTVGAARRFDGGSGRRFGAQLEATAPGFAFCRIPLELADEGDRRSLTVALVRAGRLRGRVVDPEGRPHAGARVALFGAAGSGAAGAADFSEHGEKATTSGEDGGYSIEAAPVCDEPDGWVVRAWREADPGGWPRMEGEPLRAVVVPGTTVTLPDLVVPRLACAWVRVVDAAGSPVAGARVEGEFFTGPGWRSDGRGLALVSGVERVVVRTPGFARAWSERFEAREIDPPVVTVALARGVTLRGRVVDPAGRPLTRVEVLVFESDLDPETARAALARSHWPPGGEARLLGRADVRRDGAFAVRDLPRGSCHAVARRGSFHGDSAEVEVAADLPCDAQDVRLVLPAEELPAEPPRGSIDVVLVAPPGCPPVTSERRITLAGRDLRVGGRLVEPGRVRFEGLRFGVYDLTVNLPRCLAVRRDGIALDEQRPQVELEVVLESGARATGRVTGFDGSRLRQRRLRLCEEPDVVHSCDLAPDGTFDVGGLRSLAPYRVEIEAVDPAGPGGARRRWWVAADGGAVRVPAGGASGLEIVAVPAGLLELFVDEALLSPDTTLRVEPEGAAAITATIAPLRHFRSFVLPPGRVRLACGRGAEETASDAVVVVAGEVAQFNLRPRD